MVFMETKLGDLTYLLCEESHENRSLDRQSYVP